jgi:hypothetical protein
VSLKGLPKDDYNELLCQLLKAIHTNFQTCDNPEKFLVREPASLVVMTESKTAVLVGASNLNKCGIFFSQAVYNVVDLTIPGWVASEANIKSLLQKTTQYRSNTDNLFVFDLSTPRSVSNNLTEHRHCPSRRVVNTILLEMW